jgi:para-nitrobenzyl esterase
MYNAAGGADGIIVSLPAAGWRALGSQQAPKGYRYQAPSRSDPIQRVDVKADRIRVKGGGAGFTYTLDEPAQGRVGLRLRLGTGFVWCAEVAARGTGNPPSTAKNDRPGKFTGERSGAPAACTPAPPAAVCATSTSPAAGTVLTRRGPVTGVARGATWAYLGIPFSAPPLGTLRWRPPAESVCWSTPLVADAYRAQCPQYADGPLVGEEDCLQLNVWTPQAPAPPRPVMVWIHGGAHEQGSGTVEFYDGQRLAEREDVVVVTINYRLGPFGFLAHPALTAEGGIRASGNFGMLDQIAALEWVRDNVAAFGGDPDRVTLFGQSAGSVSICRLLVSPRAAGLFAGVILQSGACVATPLSTAEGNGITRVADVLGCSAAADVPACLRSRSTADVMATLTPITDGGTNTLGRLSYDGVIDGYALPDAPRTLIATGSLNRVPVILGSTADENGRFAPPLTTQAEYEAATSTFLGLGPTGTAAAVAQYPASSYGGFREAYIALTTDSKFTCQARQDARLLAAVPGSTVYRYWFDDIADNSSPTVASWGAFHGIDILYALGSIEDLVPVAGASDLALAGAMQGYWARFAATGDPNGGTVAWTPYAAGTDPYLHLTTPIAGETGLRTANCDFWDALAGGGP